jgi:L-threonylcarbamoyladenylate synthase
LELEVAFVPHICSLNESEERDLAAAVGRVIPVLESGGLVLLPAEGLYGLHVVARLGGARERLRRTKGDPSSRPYIVLVGSYDEARPWVGEVSAAARRQIGNAWPGPLTLVLPAAPDAPRDLVRSGEIAVRCPGTRFLRALASAAGGLLSTSANRSGQPPPADLGAVAPEILEACDFAVDGGALCGVGSTLARPEADGSLTVLREGLWTPDYGT